MAVGKNKKLGKKKKGTQRKADPFIRKEWYDVRAPSTFKTRAVGKTFTTKSTGNKLARDNLVGRVFTVSLGDLNEKKEGDEDAWRKIKLRVEEVQGTQCLTGFYGMDLTTDKMRSLVRKWHTLIEAHTDVKTTDGYTLRLFCIGFTSRRKNQQRKTSYAQAAQVRAIRKKMIEIMHKEADDVELKELVAKFNAESIGREIEKSTQGIYPLQNVLIRKVKMLRAPKLDISKLLDLHGGAAEVAADAGKVVERADEDKGAAAASS